MRFFYGATPLCQDKILMGTIGYSMLAAPQQSLLQCAAMSKRIVLAMLAASLALGAHAQQGIKPPVSQSKPKAAANTQKKPAAEPDNPGVKEVDKIFACVAAGLPEGWRRAWVVVTELSGDDKERTLEGKFQYSLDAAGADPVNLVPCNAREVAQGVYALNDFLEPEKRQWKVATLSFTSDGKFEIKYDYTR